MWRRFLATILPTALLCAQNQAISYRTMAPDILRQRLDSPPKKNEEREARLFRMFEEAGCKPDELRRQKLPASKHSNVICSLPGAVDDAIVVGAHLDMTGSGSGVVDNWSGASMLPSLYEGHSKEPRKHTWIFVGFTLEEAGLVGSKFYANRLKKEAFDRHRAMINIDSVGTSPAKVWVSRSDPRLLEGLLRMAGALQMQLTGVNVEQVGDSDSHSFAARRIPVVDLHSLTQGTLPILHTAKDQADRIVFEDYESTYRLLSAYLAYLDTNIDSLLAKPLKPRSQRPR
ncbi:MAG: M28 family peptidase [Bryobacteraceae bacterium]